MAHLVYQRGRLVDYKLRGDIVYRKFDGVAWGDALELSTHQRDADQWDPDIALDGTELYVVWEDLASDTDIWARHYDGVEWQSPVEVSVDILGYNQENPTVAASNGTAYFFWVDYELGEKWNRYRTFDGDSWSDVMNVGESYRYTTHPQVESFGGVTHFAWRDATGIKYRELVDGTFSEAIEVGHPSGNNYEPTLACDGGAVLIAFRADYDVYLRWSDGVTWHDLIKISSNDTNPDKGDVSVAADLGTGNVVWSERLDIYSPKDIIYRRGPLDMVAPISSMLAVPGFWQNDRSLNLSWTAADDYSLDRVILYHSSSTNNVSWEPWEAWPSNATALGAEASGVFQFIADSDGFHRFHTVAVDRAGRVEPAPPTYDVLVGVDATPPTGSIVIEDGAQWVARRSVTLGMTFSHNLTQTLEATTGEDLLEVRVSDQADLADASWFHPTASMGWTLSGGDGQKRVYMQIRSVSGLVSSTYQAATALDTTPPTATMAIDGGASFTNTTRVHIALTFTDLGSGVMEMILSEDDAWSDASWQEPNETLVWDLSSGDGQKRLYLKVLDFVGWESQTIVGDILLDTTPPTAAVVINAGDDYVSSRSITLDLSLGDEGSGVVGVRVSQQPDLTPSQWLEPTNTLSITLEPGDDGSRRVYLQVRDRAGWISDTASDDIILDTVPPSATMVINDGQTRTNSTMASLALTFEDETSGVAQMRLSESPDFGGAEWTTPEGLVNWQFTPGEGVRQLYLQVTDNAGLISITVSDDIIVDTEAPAVASLDPAPDGERVDINVVIVVAFTEPMNRGSIEEAFKLLSGGAPVGGSMNWSDGDKRMTFSPIGPLAEGTTYKVIIDSTGSDLVGNTMADPYEAAFSTEGRGPGAPTDNQEDGSSGLLWLAVVLLVGLAVVASILTRRRRR